MNLIIAEKEDNEREILFNSNIKKGLFGRTLIRINSTHESFIFFNIKIIIILDYKDTSYISALIPYRNET